MGGSNSLENFKEKTNEIFCGFVFIQAYINDRLIITNGDWYDNLEKMELTLKNLQDNGLKCNIEKVILRKTEMGYPDFWVTCTGI